MSGEFEAVTKIFLMQIRFPYLKKGEEANR